MKFDSYPRFLKSDVYRQSLVAEIEGGLLPCEEGEEEREIKARGFFWKVPVLKYTQCLPGNDLSYLTITVIKQSLFSLQYHLKACFSVSGQ